MARTITRQTLKLFGQDGATSDFGQFGSQAAGSPVTTKTISTMQQLTAWLDGWQDAVAAGNAPYLQDMNTAFYVMSYMIAYALQDGVPEWDSGTSYFIGCIVKRPGAPEFYSSLTDANLNQALPTAGSSNANWQFLNGVIGGVSRLGGVLAMNSAKITGLAAGSANGDALRYEQLIGLYMLLTGGTMSGAIAMGANKITGLADGTLVQDAASWGQAAVKQTVVGTSTTQNTLTATAYTATSLTVTITPKFSTSRIRLMAVLNGNIGASSNNIYGTIMRGAAVANLAGSGGSLSILNSGVSTSGMMPMTAIDSPATTSPVVYTVYVLGQNSNSYSVGGGGFPITQQIIAEEIV